MLTYTQVLAGAGNETTGRLIGWLAKVLAEHADQRRMLVDDRALLPRAIDETLRFEPTGPHLARYGRQRDAPPRRRGQPRSRRYDDPDRLSPTSTVRGWEQLRILLPADAVSDYGDVSAWTDVDGLSSFMEAAHADFGATNQEPLDVGLRHRRRRRPCHGAELCARRPRLP